MLMFRLANVQEDESQFYIVAQQEEKLRGWTVAIKYPLSLPDPRKEETPCWLLIHQGLYKFGLGTSICNFITHPNLYT